MVEFVNNRLVIIVPPDNPGGIEDPFDLAKSGLRIVTATEEVPIRRYADALIAALGALPNAPAGFADAYAANLLPGVENVGAVRAAVEIGEADAAIVYVTDAFASGSKVLTIDVPDEANPIAEYGAVAIKDQDVAPAHAFLDWVLGPVGQSIFGSFGFLPPA
jgi:molybdate transport system substrate-binding protein